MRKSFKHVDVDGWRDELEQLQPALRASILTGDPPDVGGSCVHTGRGPKYP
jgi:hypothetical protein